MLSFFDIKRQFHPRPESLPFSIIFPRVKSQLPNTGSLMFLDHALHWNLFPISVFLLFGIPVGNSTIGIGDGGECDAGALGRWLTGESCNDTCRWPSSGGVKDVAGYGVFAGHIGSICWLWKVRGEGLKSGVEWCGGVEGHLAYDHQ